MFTERLNRLLTEVCRTSTGEFAKIAKYDRSYVTHLRNGDRIPKPNRKAADRLAAALYVCACEKGARAALCELAGALPEQPEEEICAAVRNWLFEGCAPGAASGKATLPVERGLRGSFGKRLGAAMELANISNLRLARALNVDPSVIGKYRSGLRVPRVNHPLIHEISRVLAGRIFALDRVAGLCRLVGAAREELAGEEAGAQVLERWLRDFKALDTSLIESFFDDMDSFSPNASALPAPETAAGDAAGDAADGLSVYLGIAGMRRAVLRFLDQAIRENRKLLLLYSDQSLDWMTGDSDYLLRWSALMNAYVRGGGTFRMIHHVDRGLEEMLEAVRTWMPLYMSGAIESWYCVKSCGERFAHTLFLAPESCCVSSAYVAGREERARYFYSTDKPELEYFRGMYESLFADCRPLIQMVPDGLRPSPAVVSKGADIHVVNNTLALPTMPRELLDRILDRSQLPEAVRGKIIADWQSRWEEMEKLLKTVVYHSCIPLPDEEKLRACAVRLDTDAAELCYTPEEYAAHIRALLALADKYPSYRLHPLDAAPFSHIRIAASERMAALRYRGGAAVTFVSSHPLLSRATVNYAERLEAQYDYNRLTLREALKRYL